MAYRLAVYLNNLGHASIFMPRDGYGSLEILLKKMKACFSHVYAGKYAGLGTIGYSHNLLNPKYGPRARYVSVLTSAAVPAMRLSRRILQGCRLCERLCPTQAMRPVAGNDLAELDAVQVHAFPSGVGSGKSLALRRLLKVLCHWGRIASSMQHQCPCLPERTRSDRCRPLASDYKHLVHMRTHGSDGDRKY